MSSKDEYQTSGMQVGNKNNGSNDGSSFMNGEGNTSQWNHWMSNFQGLFSSNTVHLSNTANDNGSSRATRVTSNGSSSSIVTSAIVSPDESLKFNSTQMAILAPSQLSNAVDNDETRWLHEDTIDANSAKWSIYKGLIYSSLSSLCFSLCAAIVKYLRDIHPGELAVFRFLGIFLLSIPLVHNHGYEPLGPPSLRHFLLLRGITGATSLFLRFLAFRHLPIADASVIIFSVPVFVSIFACVFLDESCGIFQVSIVVLTMIGLGLTTRLPTLFGSSLHEEMSRNESQNSNSSLIISNSTNITSITEILVSNATSTPYPNSGDDVLTLSGDHLVGITAALTSTIFAAAVYIVIKKAKTVHYSVIMFNFGWVALIETVILTFLMDGYSLPTKTIEWFYIVILALLSFTGQVLLTRSLQLEAAGVVAVVRAATDISLAFIWQMLFFYEYPDAWSTSGAFLVTFCVALTGVRKWLLTLPDHDDRKIKLSKFIK